MSKEPLIAPEEPYETEEGYRTHTIFPCGMVREEDNTVKIYYGASDMVVCMASTTVDDLIRICCEEK